MKLVKARFFNKLGDTTKEATTQGRLEEPRVVAKNWYQVNTNQRLLYFLTIKGNFELFDDFDSVEIKGKKYIILDKRENGINGILFEVGIGGRK